MKSTSKPPADPQTIEQIVDDTLSGAAHVRAWSAVVNALNETDPTWAQDLHKSGVEQAVAWIKSKGTKQ